MLLKSLLFRSAGVAALTLALSLPTASADEAALGPVESFEAWRDTMSEGRFGDTFALLPERYQNDVNRLTSTFAEKMDADIWEGVVGILGTISNILNNKKEIVAGTKFFGNMGEEEQAKVMENWDNAAEMTAAFTESDVLDLEVWKKGNVGKVLNGPFSDFVEGLTKMEIPGQEGLGDAMEKMKGAKAELVSEDGDSAVLRVTDPKGHAEERRIQRVQGRWVPAQIAEGWDDGIAQASGALDQMKFDAPEFQQQKMAMMMGFGMAHQMLKQLEEAKSSEDFDRTIDAMRKLFGAAIPNQL